MNTGLGIPTSKRSGLGTIRADTGTSSERRKLLIVSWHGHGGGLLKKNKKLKEEITNILHIGKLLVSETRVRVVRINSILLLLRVK